MLGSMQNEIRLIVLGIARDPAEDTTVDCASTPEAMYLARQGLHNLSNSVTSIGELKGSAADECHR